MFFYYVVNNVLITLRQLQLLQISGAGKKQTVKAWLASRLRKKSMALTRAKTIAHAGNGFCAQSFAIAIDVYLVPRSLLC